MNRTLTVAEAATCRENNNIQLVFENCSPFIDYISEINNTQTDNAKGIDLVIPMYNLIVYRDNYAKTSGSLWQYYRDKTALTDAGALDNFHGNSALFKF